MPNIYLLPGLATDDAIFSYLNWGDISVNYINWIEPLKNETIESYARRLAEKITHPNPILIGLSFGGMISVEISKIIPVQKVILLSSAKGRAEIPFYLRWLGYTRLQFIVPPQWLLRPSALAFWFFNLKKKEHKQLLADIFKRTNYGIFRWSANAILTWKNKTIPKNLIHIHGTADRVLPVYFAKADYKIKGAGHCAVMTHAEEIMGILKEIILVD